METLVVTLGDVLLFDAKLPPGIFIVWNDELAQPVYIGRAIVGCDQQIVEHWHGGPSADKALNAAMHGSEPYCLDWTIEVYPTFSGQTAADLEQGLSGKLSPLLH